MKRALHAETGEEKSAKKSSKYRGVSWDKNKNTWGAKYQVQGKQINIKNQKPGPRNGTLSFDNEEDAAVSLI